MVTGFHDSGKTLSDAFSDGEVYVSSPDDAQKVESDDGPTSLGSPKHQESVGERRMTGL